MYKKLALLAIAGYVIEAAILWAFGVNFLDLRWYEQWLLVVAPMIVTSRVIFYKRHKELMND